MTLDIPTIRAQYLGEARPDLGETLAVLGQALDELERVAAAAHQLRHALAGQHDAAGHAIAVHAQGENCSWCRLAANECDDGLACPAWKRWQADYEAAMSLELPATTRPTEGEQ